MNEKPGPNQSKFFESFLFTLKTHIQSTIGKIKEIESETSTTKVQDGTLFEKLVKEISEEVEKISLDTTTVKNKNNIQDEMLLLFLGSFIEEEVNERNRTRPEKR